MVLLGHWRSGRLMGLKALYLVEGSASLVVDMSITLYTLLSVADSHRHGCDIGALARSIREGLVVSDSQTDAQKGNIWHGVYEFVSMTGQMQARRVREFVV
jgi:hypothetical protein